MSTLEHGDTRPCTKCGAILTWHADTRTWQGKHEQGCYVPGKTQAPTEAEAFDRDTRGPAHDERENIGANGQPEWRVVMQMASPGARFEEIIHVNAATETGAICLGQESRINIAGISAEPLGK